MQDILTQLISQAQMINISLNQIHARKILDYLTLLKKANKAYNLTSLDTLSTMLPYHILDSLSTSLYIKDIQTMIDVGSGGGLPGIPLAILHPHIHFILIDCREKKIHFLRHVIRTLKLPNVSAYHHRIECFHTSPVDAVIFRAFDSIHNTIAITEHVIKNTGQWFAMKGVYPSKELEEIKEKRPSIHIHRIAQLTIPGQNVQRHLVILSKTQSM